MIKNLVSYLIIVTVLLNFSLYPIAITEKESEKSQMVQVLKLLNFIRGYEGNTLKLDANITRAELVAIAVRTRGLEEVAKEYLDKEEDRQELNRRYNDVSREHWANPYIHIANKAGLIEGIGNSRFDPDADILYQNALAIILRVLGYGVYINNIGNNPKTYIVVAEDIGVTNNIELKMNEKVTRRDAMKMIFNSLTINIREQIPGPGARSMIVNKSILSNMDIDKKCGKLDSVKDNYVYIENEKYKIDLIDNKKYIEKSYIGIEVCFYYIETKDKEKLLLILNKSMDY